MMRAVFFLLLVFCTGCSAEMTEEDISKAHFVKAEWEVADKTPEERAMVIKARLKQIDEIIGTAVVVEGHTAIIGLRLEENMEQNEIDAVKQEADTIARSADVRGKILSLSGKKFRKP